MANGLMPLAGVCALYLVCLGCSSDPDPDEGAAAGTSAGGGGAAGLPGAGAAGESTSMGGVTRGGTAASGSAPSVAGTGGRAGGAADPSAGESSGPPPAIEGQSIYALQCQGDSKDCSLGTVPCLGISSPTPNVAAGWACSNRCSSDADCSDAPSGAEARASCVSFSSARHCLLVCQNENQSSACPEGMTCYTPAKSPIGYCLWP